MAEFISRIDKVGPTYPVRPVKQPSRDEKSGDEKSRDRDDGAPPKDDDQGKPDKHRIDEHV